MGQRKCRAAARDREEETRRGSRGAWQALGWSAQALFEEGRGGEAVRGGVRAGVPWGGRQGGGQQPLKTDRAPQGMGFL